MTILITGANRGIGLGLARSYADRGAAVIGTARQTLPLATNDNIDWHCLDVTRQSSFETLTTALDGRAISLLICNAGVYLDKGQSLADGFAPDLWHDSFQTNVLGPFLTIQNLLPNLQRAKAPKIAIIASKMGSNTHAKGGAYIYRASKAAAINLASNLALDLAPLGIAVGAYHPGWVKTDMGGTSADITTEQSVAGLISCFDALNLNTTGCYQSYDGAALPY